MPKLRWSTYRAEMASLSRSNRDTGLAPTLGRGGWWSVPTRAAAAVLLSSLALGCDPSSLRCDECGKTECEQVQSVGDSSIDYAFTEADALAIAHGEWTGTYSLPSGPLAIAATVTRGDDSSSYGTVSEPGVWPDAGVDEGEALDDRACAQAELGSVQVEISASDPEYSGRCKVSVSDIDLPAPEERSAARCVPCFRGVYSDPAGEGSMRLLFCDDGSLWAWSGLDGKDVEFERIGRRSASR